MDSEPSIYVSYKMEAADIALNDKLVRKNHKTRKCGDYSLIRYDKEFVADSDLDIRKYRSVIVSYISNHLLSFTPPKSIHVEQFRTMYPSISDGETSYDFLITDAIEGTMISLFYDKDIGTWEIATKSSVGCDYFFYRTEYYNEHKTQPTFKAMFLEALTSSPLDDLNDSCVLKCFPKNYSYTFVLQHPQNHMVLNIEKPKLYLVAVYDIHDDKAITIPQIVYQEWDCFTNLTGLIDFPGQYQGFSYNDLIDKFASIHSDHNHMGVMITNMISGHRCSIKNPVYENVRLLRGNNPSLQYHYLCLRRMGKVQEFLLFFPMYKKLFYTFYDQFTAFVNDLHASYISYYILKNTEPPISKKYMGHIYKLHHSIYLPSVRNPEMVKVIITKHVVREYMDSLDPGAVLFYLNYDLRKMNTSTHNDGPEAEPYLGQECLGQETI